jgi:hypothetical protein
MAREAAGNLNWKNEDLKKAIEALLQKSSFSITQNALYQTVR